MTLLPWTDVIESIDSFKYSTTAVALCISDHVSCPLLDLEGKHFLCVSVHIVLYSFIQSVLFCSGWCFEYIMCCEICAGVKSLFASLFSSVIIGFIVLRVHVLPPWMLENFEWFKFAHCVRNRSIRNVFLWMC